MVLMDIVQARLAHFRQVWAVDAAAGSWSDEGREDPSEEIRRLRESWDLGRDHLGLSLMR